MIRATKKLMYDLVREHRKTTEPEKGPEVVRIKAYITLSDQTGIEHLNHRVGKRELIETVKSDGRHKFRKYIIRKFRLKSLCWNLWRRDGVAWACMPKMPQVEDGDEFKLEIYGKKRRQPNKPGSSKRLHFDRPNSRKTRRDFTWIPPQPLRHDTSTEIRLAAPNQIGYRELPVLNLQEEEQQRIAKQEQALETLRTRNEELKKAQGERTKLQSGGTRSTEEELQRLKQENKMLEMMQGAKTRLDDRDEWRRKKDADFRVKHIDPPAPRYVKHVDEDEETAEAKQQEAVSKLEAFKRSLAEQRTAKARRKEEKVAEGKARQAKAELRTKKARG
jgi:hypothetical protein